MTPLEFLQKDEWTMGNGQCPDCCGVHKGWLGHPLHLDNSTIGHKIDCGRAKAIRDLGGETYFVGEFSDPTIYEISWESGFLSTKVKDRVLPE